MDYFAKNLIFLRKKEVKTQQEIADKLKIKRVRYNHYETGHSNPNFELLQNIAKHFNISIENLLNTDISKTDNNIVNEPQEKYLPKTLINKGIPLVSSEALAGNGNSVFSIQQSDIQEYYVVPDFNHIDFMLRVKGNSMYPKYSSGDIVACRVIKERTYIQWNKTHLLATKEQGLIIKRLKKSEAKDHWICISDNKDYDPFEIPIKEITGLALVIGVIRLE